MPAKLSGTRSAPADGAVRTPMLPSVRGVPGGFHRHVTDGVARPALPTRGRPSALDALACGTGVSGPRTHPRSAGLGGKAPQTFRSTSSFGTAHLTWGQQEAQWPTATVGASVQEPRAGDQEDAGANRHELHALGMVAVHQCARQEHVCGSGRLTRVGGRTRLLGRRAPQGSLRQTQRMSVSPAGPGLQCVTLSAGPRSGRASSANRLAMPNRSMSRGPPPSAPRGRGRSRSPSPRHQTSSLSLPVKALAFPAISEAPSGSYQSCTGSPCRVAGDPSGRACR